MEFWDYVIIIGSSLIALIIGISIATLSEKMKEWKQRKKAKDFLEGNAYNILDIDGEQIHVNKFKWKTPNGEIKRVEIPLKGGNVF